MYRKVLESSMTKAGRCLAAVAVVFMSVLLLACDTAVYHPDEIRAQKKFQSIVAGLTEEELRKQLGEPLGYLVFDQTRGTYQYFTLQSSSPAAEFRSLDAITNVHPSELRLLATSRQAHKILVFVDGTVHGYFYFGKAGILEDKAVVVS
jgi:hypothetical protein